MLPTPSPQPKSCHCQETENNNWAVAESYDVVASQIGVESSELFRFQVCAVFAARHHGRYIFLRHVYERNVSSFTYT